VDPSKVIKKPRTKCLHILSYYYIYISKENVERYDIIVDGTEQMQVIHTTS